MLGHLAFGQSWNTWAFGSLDVVRACMHLKAEFNALGTLYSFLSYLTLVGNYGALGNFIVIIIVIIVGVVN